MLGPGKGTAMHQEIDAVIMGRIKDALQPLEHNWSIDKYCQDLTARAALPGGAAPVVYDETGRWPCDGWAPGRVLAELSGEPFRL